MKVVIYPSDEGACCAYRLRYPVEALSNDVEASFSMEIPALQYPVPGRPPRVVPLPVDADVIVWGRPKPLLGTLEVMEAYARQGVAQVVDIDDDFTALHADHPARQTGWDWRLLRRACALADLVTVSTPALAERFGAHGRVVVLPNCVPGAMLALSHGRQSDSPGVVGWAGITETHCGDLAVTHGGVQGALERTGWRFRVIGPKSDVCRQLSLTVEPETTGWLTLDAYQDALGSLDIGIVPLADTAFNHSKSFLKGIEMAARGVPFIASPVPSYRQLANEGIGLLSPSRGRSWRSNLLRLMDDENLRNELSLSGREAVRAYHVYESESWRWAEAWQAAIDNRRTRASVR